LMLPGVDGFDVCRALSASQPRTPIIILTARAEKDDKIRGLELGADDYVTKPVALDELLARIHAVLRRTQPRDDRVWLGDVTVDVRAGRAERGGRDLELSHREVEVLRYLIERRGRVVGRDELLRAVWGYREVPVTRTVDNFIARLRRKIERDPHHPRHIRTAHGGGYCLVIDSQGDTNYYI
ncbi:MAG: response regulator transcription factor, partial [Acidobacteria bacterium]|nr:response regulator transcription factor [Acidobacteriota bacterium]